MLGSSVVSLQRSSTVLRSMLGSSVVSLQRSSTLSSAMLLLSSLSCLPVSPCLSPVGVPAPLPPSLPPFITFSYTCSITFLICRKSLAISLSRLNVLYPNVGWGSTKNVTLMNFGSFFSTTISTTQAGTVSFNRTPSVSPPASLASSLYNVLPPTSLNMTGVCPGTEKYSFPVPCLPACPP